jgi:hypothetical protein
VVQMLTVFHNDGQLTLYFGRQAFIRQQLTGQLFQADGS